MTGQSQSVQHAVIELFPRASDGDPRWGSPLPTVDGVVRSVDVVAPIKGEGLTLPGFTQTRVDFPSEVHDQCWERWAGAGNLQYISPEPYSTFALPKTLQTIFAHDLQRDSQHALGTFERMDEFVSLVMPGRDAETRLFSYYADALSKVQPGTIVNWQYYMFEGAMALFGQDLRDRGVIQTFHAHDPLPDSLHRSEWGRGFLKALSLMDVVYLHTDRYANNLSTQLEAMGLNVPLVRRFDLGINREFIEGSLKIATAQNFRTFFDNYDALPARQREFLQEVLRSAATTETGAATVPHRFMCIDRLASIKGMPVLLEGIDRFLAGRLAAGAQMDDLRRDFRFFFLEDGTSRFERDPGFIERTMNSNHLGHRYIVHSHDCLMDLKEKYPGVIWTGDHMFGSARPLLPLLMRGCHMVSGGGGEGLNLAVAEGALANIDQDTSMLMGNNAGFTIRMEEVGLQDRGFFPQPKDPADFSRAIEQLVHIADNYPGQLRSMKREVVEYILTRNDSVLTGGEEVLR